LELDPEISVAYIEDTEVSGLRANKIISEKSYEGQKRVGVEVFVVKRDLVYKFYLSTTEEEYGKALPMFESVLSSVQII
ncbi:MAG: hypothetical protein JNK26_03110, partial [Candidatus Doudnabacteria bacterium]|nr:hypothetical protein [Candidatus Doudnabacteria bacterium]